MKVTFGIINCNRLHYLKACVESLLLTTQEYSDKEIIVVDNASTEPGTEEYLEDLRQREITVVKNESRDSLNEYPRALNTITNLASGDIVCHLTGDSQFIISGNWIDEYVSLLKERNDIGSVSLNGLRKREVEDVESRPNHRLKNEVITVGSMSFIKDNNSKPFANSGNVFYKKEVLEEIGPWAEDNIIPGRIHYHAAKMNRRSFALRSIGKIWHQFHPIIPVCAEIYGSNEGTNCQIRENRRIGEYVRPCSNTGLYYKIRNIEEINRLNNPDKMTRVIELEKILIGCG